MTARPASRMRGISLIEALVALAVVGIGMIGMVGVQATLRSNADVAKQRSTAVRLLQTGTEEWRAFAILEDDASVDFVDYTDLDPLAPEIDTTTVDNADYERTREVVELAAPLRGKLLAATVDWTDRAGDTQTVQLATVIAGIAPELAASLAIPPDGDPVRRPHDRHRGIPPLAKDLGDGTSAIKPPSAPNTVAWRFDNVTGLITLCTVDPAVAAQTSDLTTANLVCAAQNALGVSGYVRYALTPAQPTEADARSPLSDPLPAVTVAISRSDGGLAPICYEQSELVSGKYIQYNCAVPVTVTVANPIPTWSGSVSLAFNPADLLAADQAENSPGKYKVCSYARPGTRVGNAVFPGGGNQITLTAGGGSSFRAWAAGSRIDLTFGDWLYVYNVSAAVALPAAGEVTQAIPVSGTLPGVGNPLSGAAFADVWPYANISVPLVNHNYLVIRAGNAPAVAPPFTCPISTVAHQPAA